MAKADLKVDLHPIYNKGELIDEALEDAIWQAEEKKLREIEIVYGKGKGQLKARVLRFLDRKDIKGKYHSVKKDPDNSGRIFVYFKREKKL